MASTSVDDAGDAGDASTSSAWAQARESSHQLILQTALEDLESKAASLEQALLASQAQSDSQTSLIATLQSSKQTLQSKANQQADRLIQLQGQVRKETSEVTKLEDTHKTDGERMERLESEADKLREEISRLTKSNTEYQEKMVQMETQTKLGDSEVTPLRFQVQRLTTEVDTLGSHNQWLHSELESKTTQLVQLRKDHAQEVTSLRVTVDGTQEEATEATTLVTRLEGQLSQLETKTQRVSKDLAATQVEAANEKADADMALKQAERLSQMQQEQLGRLQQKHDSLATQLEAIKTHALDAEQESNRALSIRQNDLQVRTKQILQDQAEEFQRKISGLEDQVVHADRRRKSAEDGLLLTEGPRRLTASSVGAPSRPLAIRDGRATINEEDEPLNLTDLYGRLAGKEDALAAESLRRKKAEILLQRIESEIEASAPLYLRQRQEYEDALERQGEYQKRLDAAIDEAKAAREESQDVQRELGRLQIRNKDLEGETTELAKQVQTLLVSRSGPGGQQPDAAVKEMQTNNQRLLGEVRRSRATIEDLQANLKSDTLRSQVEQYETELDTLREERKRQEVMVTSIVQQRDLYRALVANQDGNLLGSPSEEASALRMVKQQSERSKTLEQHKSKLESDLASARAELAVVDNDKQAASERLARYESLNAELTADVDRFQAEISKAKAEVARSVAEATFHREKCQRLEENLERSRNEVARVAASKNELQQINANLQNAVSKANADASRYEGDLQQAQMKLRLAQIQTETAKTAEQRIADESHQLRNEIARQGTMMASIQRLEASVSAQKATVEETSQGQVKALSEKLNATESKQALVLESLNGKIADQDIKIKDLEQNREQTVKETLEAKKECLTATVELQKFTNKCLQLDTQLRQTKKKLGETGDMEDVEGNLASKIASLVLELEAAHTQVETMKKRAATFQKLAKDNEVAVAAQTEAANAAKKAYDDEIAALKNQLNLVNTEATKGKEIITELTNDLSAQRGDRATELQEVNKRVTELGGQVDKYQKDTESSQNRYSQLESEVVVLRADVSTAQNNYERELALHAAARTDLRTAREEAEAELRLRRSAEEQKATLNSELVEERAVVEQEKASTDSTLREYENNLKETREQNTLLHGQLEQIGEQVERMQSVKGLGGSEGIAADGSTDEIGTLLKTVSELREVVKFVRTEKEMVQTQLDSARRAGERERAAAAVAKRSLDEARAELKVLQDTAQGSIAGAVSGSKGLKEKVKNAEQQTRLLGESNTLLREEVAKLQTSLSAATGELTAAKSAVGPSQKRQNQLETERAGLIAEKESLLREINDWKGRVQSLVSKFNQVDPAEHAAVVKKAETFEGQVKALEKKKVEAEEESKRIRALASRASKELMQNKTLVESHKQTITKLTTEKEALTKAQKEGASKKELDEAKTKLIKLEGERASEKIQLKGSTEMNDKLRERLRQFQKLIMDYKRKEINLTKELKDTKDLMEKDKEAPAAASTEAIKKSLVPTQAPVCKTTESKPAKETTTTATITTEKKLERATMPKVPVGGFQFAPSAPEQAKTPAKQDLPAAASQTVAAAASVKTVPAPSLSSKKRPAEPLKEPTEAKKSKAPETAPSEKPSESGQSAGEQGVAEANKPSESTVEAPKSATQRRGSSETKELSMKEKLLEKKRRLMEQMMKKKKQAQEEATKEEPAAKKAKVVETPKETEEVPPVATSASKDSALSEVTTISAKDNTGDADEEGEVEDASPRDGTVEGSKEKEESGAKAAALNADAAAFNPFGGVAAIAKQPSFGSTSGTGFGQVAPTRGFGQAAKAPGPSGGFGQTAANAPAFGQGTAFGASSGFGSAAPSGTGTLFGKKPEGTLASTTTSAFGSSSFLNMKPPGSSTVTPQFTFGSSTSITLPTPAIPSPQANAFNAFSSGSRSSSFTAKPLFGAATKKEEVKETEDGEEGEMEEPPKKADA